MCGFFTGRVTVDGGQPTFIRCPHPATYTGANSEGFVAVACFEHRHLLSTPTAIHSFDNVDDETLAQAAENQADLERMLSEPTRGT
jgi:hypothetical protein